VTSGAVFHHESHDAPLTAIMRDFRALNPVLGRHLWAQNYFVATSGNVTDDVIARYIAEQDIEPDESAFKVPE
jgi:REP element-mobilizing transposase RayT